MRWMLAVVAAVTACRGSAAVSRPAPAAAVTNVPTMADLGWLVGSWHAPALDAHWREVAGSLYGIALDDHGGYEVNIIDDRDDDGGAAPIALRSIANGRDAMTFALSTDRGAELVFADDHHRTVRLVKLAVGWRGEFTDQPGRHPIVFTMAPTTLIAAPELDTSDREFAAATAREGADGWARAFAPDGAVWRAGHRVEGDDIHTQIAATLGRGALAWQPIASGARDEIGFTLGTWTFTATGGDRASGSYATIWRRQADRSWKVVFDVGRPARHE